MAVVGWIMMFCWMGFVTLMAAYFFYRILTIKEKNDWESDMDSEIGKPDEKKAGQNT